MKASLVLDQFADTSALTKELKSKVTFSTGADGKPVALFLAGTVFEGPQAVMLCRTGQARPADDECAKELKLSLAQLEALQVDYKMNSLGINDKDDRELYRAGVIEGYNSDREYIHGPNWDAYQAAKADTGKDDI